MTATTTPPAAAPALGAGLAGGIARSARAELLRLRRWPAVWVTLGAWMTMSVLFGYLFTYLSYTGDGTVGPGDGAASDQALLAEMMPEAVPDVFLQGMPMFGGALMMVLGALIAGNGYGWGTWKTVFSQGVRRGSGVGGSLAALTVVVVLTMAVTFALFLGLSSLIATTESQAMTWPELGSIAQAFAAGFAVLEMWALVGYLLGTLARGPALAVGLGLVWSLVVENLLRGVGSLLSWVEALTAVLPGTAAGSLVGSIIGAESNGTPGVLDVVAGDRAAVTVVAWAVLALVGSVLLVTRRDVS